MAKANSFQHIDLSAVKTLARLAAKRAVQAKLRDQGVRLTTYPYAELMRQAVNISPLILNFISKLQSGRSA